LFIHITLETAPNEMQCDETISHMVTACWSYFRTRRNATAGKTTMARSKINYGCFEMLSWRHRTSNHIINICFWLLQTCTKCSYFIEENMRPGTQRLTFEVKYEHIVGRRSTVGQVPDNRRLQNFAGNQNQACRSVVKTLLPKGQTW